MGIGQRHLRNQVALGSSDIHDSAVFAPREFICDCQVGAVAHAGHRFQELLEPRRFGVNGRERVGAAVSRFVLRKSCSERRGEVGPKRIQPLVGHFENATDIGWLALVEEEIRTGRVVVSAVAAFEKFQRHERIQKIAGRSRMQAEPPLQRFEILRVFGKFCE